jgi:hypothetical protein
MPSALDCENLQNSPASFAYVAAVLLTCSPGDKIKDVFKMSVSFLVSIQLGAVLKQPT